MSPRAFSSQAPSILPTLLKNRYQSLHTVVMTEENIPLEIQVRRREMHSQAEFGLAAHWRYKQEQGSMKIV